MITRIYGQQPVSGKVPFPRYTPLPLAAGGKKTKKKNVRSLLLLNIKKKVSPTSVLYLKSFFVEHKVPFQRGLWVFFFDILNPCTCVRLLVPCSEILLSPNTIEDFHNVHQYRTLPSYTYVSYTVCRTRDECTQYSLYSIKKKVNQQTLTPE